MERFMKNFFLFLAKSKILTRAAKAYGLRLGASRFVAGETLEEAALAVKELNDRGLAVTIDYLGEFVDSEAEASERTKRLIDVLEMIGKEKLTAHVSVKLTSLGMNLSESLVLGNMRRILEAAEAHSVFVTIDMEDFAHCQKTLEIFRMLKQEYDHVGTVLQAYLYRSLDDASALKALCARLRLVKGAYKESPEVAFPEKKDVDENFKKLIKACLLNGNFTAVATHDEKIIAYTKQLVKEHNIARDQIEFQMLYGIRPERQLELAREGYTMRVYVPFGTDWYGYFMRRLAERPANAAFVLKSLFK